MQNLKKISIQTFFQLIGKVVTSISTFIILGLVARNYGEEGTGVFTLALTYLGIFYLLSDFGLNAHELKKGIINWHKLLGTRIVWGGVLTIIAIILMPLAPFSSPILTQTVLVGSLTILASAVYVTSNLIFQSKLRYDLSVLASSAGIIIGLLAFIYLISFKPPVYFLAVAQIISWFFVCITSLLLIRSLGLSILPKFDFSYTLQLFKNSWPLAATLTLNVLYFRADSFLISFFRSNSEVGIYNVAYSFLQSVLVLPTFIMNSYYPFLLKSFKDVRVIGFMLFFLSVLVTASTFLLAPFLIQVLTGEGFAGSSDSLRILSLGFPAYFLSALFMWIMVAKRQYKRMLFIYFVGLLVNFSLNLYFIPQYSYIGASWITVLSEYLILIMQATILSL